MNPHQTENVSHLTPSERKKFFDEPGRATAFSNSFADLLRAVQRQVVARYLPPENTQRLRHSGTHSHPGVPEAYQSGLQTHSSRTTITFEELINNDLSAIARCIAGVRDDMERQFAQMMYRSISSASEQSGNVVDAQKEGSLPAAFARMLEKIEFSVDKDGNVTLPQIHVGPDTFDSFQKAISEASPEYHNEIAEIMKRKRADALEREADRKARFVKYGE